MLIDGLTLTENSSIINMTVANGTVFPDNGNAGEMFYLTTAIPAQGRAIGLYVFSGSDWLIIESGMASLLAEHAGDSALHLTSGQNTWIDSITASAAEVNNLAGVTSNLQTQLTTISGTASTASSGLSTHASDVSTHLTSAQNTWLDSITASAAEINYVDGVTSSIQTQLDAKIPKAGGSLDSGANLVFSGGGSISGLPTTPPGANHAASKAYVDSLTAGITWKNPVDLINLVGSLTAPPVSPVNLDAYVVGVGGATGAWSGFVAGDVVQYHSSGTPWLLVQPLAVGQRYGVSFYNETAPTGFLATHLLEIATITNAAPASLGATFEVPVVGNAVFVGNPNAALFGNAYTYVASTAAPSGNPTYSWIQFSGTNATNAGTGLIYSGNVLSVNLGAGIAELPSDEVGIDFYASGGIMTTVDGTASSSATDAQISLTKVGTAGTYKSITTDAHGRVTGGTNPTTVAGFGIIDAVIQNGTASLSSLTMAGPAALKSFTETYVSPTITTGTLALDLSTASVFTVSLNANITTISISNLVSGKTNSFILMFTADGTARAITWPASFKWADGTPPVLTTTSGKIDIFTIFTVNNGTSWIAVTSGQNF